MHILACIFLRCSSIVLLKRLLCGSRHLSSDLRSFTHEGEKKMQVANQVSLGTNLEIIALCLVVLWLCYRSLKKRGIF